MMLKRYATAALAFLIAVTPSLAGFSFQPGLSLFGTAMAVSIGSVPHDVDTTVAELAAAGVPVFDDLTSTSPIIRIRGPRSPLYFVRWQVQNMAAEVSAHGGYLGSQLDEMAPMPKEAPPFSTWLAVWASRYTSVAARTARQLIVNPDWLHPKTIVFPTEVLALFIADLTQGTGNDHQGPTGRDPNGLIVASNQVSDNGGLAKCGSISNLINGAINGVFNGLKSLSGNSVFQWIVSVLQLGITIIVNGVLTPLTAVLTPIVETIGIITTISSLLKPWKINLSAAPLVSTLAVDPNKGVIFEFTAQVNTRRLDIPAGVACALNVIGIDLKALEKNQPIQFGTQQDVHNVIASVPFKNTVLDIHDAARMEVQTRTETPEVAKGTPHCATFRGFAIVHPKEVEAIRERLLQALTKVAHLPPPVNNIVENALRQATTQNAESKLQQMLEVRSNVVVEVTYHTKNPPSPQSSQTPEGGLTCPDPAKVSAIVGGLDLHLQMMAGCQYMAIYKVGPESTHHEETSMVGVKPMDPTREFDMYRHAPGFSYSQLPDGTERLTSISCGDVGRSYGAQCGWVVERKNGKAFWVYAGPDRRNLGSQQPVIAAPLSKAIEIAQLASASLIGPPPQPSPSPQDTACQ